MGGATYAQVRHIEVIRGGIRGGREEEEDAWAEGGHHSDRFYSSVMRKFHFHEKGI